MTLLRRFVPLALSSFALLTLAACSDDTATNDEAGTTSTESTGTTGTTGTTESDTDSTETSTDTDSTETGTDSDSDSDSDSTETGTDTDSTETGTDTMDDTGPDPAVLSLEYGPIKQFHFSWTEAAGALDYQLYATFEPDLEPVPVGALTTDLAQSLTEPLHRRLGVSYFVRACNDIDCADSDPVDVGTTLAEAVGYFKASNSGDTDEFGFSIALSGDGSTMAIGAVRERSGATGVDSNQGDNSTQNAGAVYVFTLEDAEWTQQAYVKASNTGEGDRFGGDVSLSENGDTLAVSAAREGSNATGVDGDQNNNLAGDSGAVYVYQRAGGSWSQQAYIKASNTDINDEFGTRIGLSADGNTLAVAADSESSAATGVGGDQADDSAGNAGAVYVFTRQEESWSQQAYLKAANTDSLDRMGHSLAISANGDTLVVGADGEASAATGINGNPADNLAVRSGAAYVFERDNGSWSQSTYVKASNAGSNDLFGFRVAISADGDTFAVGAYGESSAATGIGGNQNDDSADSAGAVYVFARDGMSWTQEAYVKASNSEEDDRFGRNLALSANGDLLAVGADGEASAAMGIDGDEGDNAINYAGAAFVFERAEGSWSQRAYVKASNTEGVDLFGYEVALSGDGDTLAVGAAREHGGSTGVGGDQTDKSLYQAGAVYLY